jgi:hypothetical protein
VQRASMSAETISAKQLQSRAPKQLSRVATDMSAFRVGAAARRMTSPPDMGYAASPLASKETEFSGPFKSTYGPPTTALKVGSCGPFLPTACATICRQLTKANAGSAAHLLSPRNISDIKTPDGTNSTADFGAVEARRLSFLASPFLARPGVSPWSRRKRRRGCAHPG